MKVKKLIEKLKDFEEKFGSDVEVYMLCTTVSRKEKITAAHAFTGTESSYKTIVLE